MEIIISNRQSSVNIDGQLVAVLRKVVRIGLTEEGIPHGAEVGVSIVNDETIADYNQRYRSVNGPTDVLAFPMMDDSETFGPLGSIPPATLRGIPPVLLGDIVISAEYAQRQALRLGLELEQELALLTVHGLLHLLGYDHDTERAKTQMFARQDKILAQSGFDGVSWE